MSGLAAALSAAGLVRPVRSRGFCPACRGWTEPGAAPRQELAPAAAVAVVVVAVAGLAWAVAVAQARPMDTMPPGGESLLSFASGWLVMMAAMMLPSALPLVMEFARRSERRRRWPIATALLVASYLGVWLGFGVACFAAYSAVRMPWSDQRTVAAAALAAAGVYALTPFKRAGEARCRELCALHGALPFGLSRSAVVAGARYAIACIRCSAGLMVAAVLIGMGSISWMAVLAAVVLGYKLLPLTARRTLALAVALSSLGVLYAVTAAPPG